MARHSKTSRKQPQSPKIKRPLFIVAGAFLGVGLLYLAYSYFSAAHYYKTYFFPATTINSFATGHLSPAEVVELIYQEIVDYRLLVYDQDNELVGTIEAEDIGFFIEIDEAVEAVLDSQNQMRWIFDHMADQHHDITYDIDFSHEQLLSLLGTWDVFSSAQMEMPRDAYVSEYVPALKGYEIIPETRGSVVNVQAAFDSIASAIYEGRMSLNLADEGLYLRSNIRADDPALLSRVATLNRICSTRIHYDWNGSEVILDGDTIHEWIYEKGNAFLIDTEPLEAFVAAHAKANDTYGTNRKFHTRSGHELSLPNGGYGWRTDRDAEAAELLALIQAGTVTDREPEYRNRGWHKGKDDIGPSYVEIDLGNQHLYLIMDGVMILDSPLVSGHLNRGDATPPGVFGLTYKQRNAVLRGATYATPVNYWMPFNLNIGMHDAGWRSSFGGDIYIDDGSHGCINLPPRVAREIYSHVETGFPVICYY